MRIPSLTLLALVATAAPLAAQADSTWREHNAAADAAMTAANYPEARRQTQAMDPLLGGHPAVAFQLAKIAALSGDTAEVLAQLRRIAAMGVISRRIGDTAFAPYRARPWFQGVARDIAANASTIAHAEVVATIPDSEAIPEDLSYEPSLSRFIVSDIHRRRL